MLGISYICMVPQVVKYPFYIYSYNPTSLTLMNTITGKILAWKQEHGDLEAQEVFVM